MDRQPIRVVIADDAADFRLLVSSTLSLDPRFEMVGEAADGNEASVVAEATQPDVIVLDVSMPGQGGMAAITDLRARVPTAAVVVMSGFDALDARDEAMRLGAAAYVQKGTALDQLVEVLTAVAGGGTAPPPAPQRAAPQDPPPAVAIDDVLGYLTHELQNPITVLSGLAATLVSSVDRLDRDAIVACADAIQRNALRLSALVRVLSDARAIETGRFEVEREPVDAAALLADRAADLRAAAPEHTVLIDAGALTGCVANMDSERIGEVLVELVTNAARHGPAGRPIEVSGAVTDTDLRIAVQDGGSGIDADRAADVFLPFLQLDPKAKGAGLGLFVARGIATAHDDHLAVDTTVALGTRVVLTLPR